MTHDRRARMSMLHGPRRCRQWVIGPWSLVIRPLEVFFAQPVLPHLLEERSRPHAGEAGGPADVSAGALQQSREVGAFEVFQHLLPHGPPGLFEPGVRDAARDSPLLGRLLGQDQPNGASADRRRQVFASVASRLRVITCCHYCHYGILATGHRTLARFLLCIPAEITDGNGPGSSSGGYLTKARVTMADKDTCCGGKAKDKKKPAKAPKTKTEAKPKW